MLGSESQKKTARKLCRQACGLIITSRISPSATRYTVKAFDRRFIVMEEILGATPAPERILPEHGLRSWLLDSGCGQVAICVSMGPAQRHAQGRPIRINPDAEIIASDGAALQLPPLGHQDAAD